MTEIHGRILVVDDNRKELKIDPKLREIPVIMISAMISGGIKNFLRKQMPKDCLILPKVLSVEAGQD